MKAFDKVKLKELLELKEQESSEQMLTLHKSTISTYSSIELEGNRFSEFISETRSEHSSWLIKGIFLSIHSTTTLSTNSSIFTEV